MKLRVRRLTKALWPALEELFGPNGASAGCWCMYWRLEKGETLATHGREGNRRNFKKLVEAGRAEGLLAFAGDQPVGWVALGRRRDFRKLDRAPSLQCGGDADEVWSLPCFFIHKDWRSQGVATALLTEALKVLRAKGAKIAEGYPVKPSRKSGHIPEAFAYTGTVPLFLKQGFEVVAKRPRGKQRVRRAP